MAVFSPVNKEDLLSFLQKYDIGTLEKFEGILEGIENTNYKVTTSKDIFILTIFEKRVSTEDLPFFINLQTHLAQKNLKCPQPISNKKGNSINILNGKTFRWGGKYSQDYSQRETLFTELGVFDSFSPTIKNMDSRIQCVFLGNIQPKLQLDVAKQINFARYIASDTMNLWINLFPKQLKNVLQISDIFLINDEEAHQFTEKKDISESAHIFHSFGPKVVIIKMGANGAYLSFEDKSVFIPVFPIDKVIDPTGAGDSFAGGLLGSLASVDYPNLVEAVLVGTAMASYCVEDFGVDGLLRATMSGLNERISVIREHMSEYGGS